MHRAAHACLCLLLAISAGAAELAPGQVTRIAFPDLPATLAGGTLGAALVAPVVSLGPTFDTSRLNESPWR